MLCSLSARTGLTCAALLVLAIVLGACGSPLQLAPSANRTGANAPPAAPPPTTPPATTSQTAPPAQTVPAENATDNGAANVRILVVHFRGSLQPLGCCNPQLYERDEFVAIQNNGKAPQNIAGWKLMNATKGYPVFTFPPYYPCIAFVPSNQSQYVANTQNYVYSAPQTVAQTFPASSQAQVAAPPVPSQINWSNCTPVPPLDETPMQPLNGQEPDRVLPMVLYPGQIILVFTDEIHCQYGGLSFRYGQGDLWNNETPDTAVLYDATGTEVSRRSYTLGK